MSSTSQLPEEDLYSISWSNPAWSHLLCTANVLDYFCDLSNPFYDRQCNNEVIRMQRLSSEQLLCMTGIEFYLHHAQEPILFVVRKQTRLSSTQVTPLAYYYIINGTVLQAPDLAILLTSRLLTTVSGLNKVLQTLAPCARYHPSDGSYSWDDPNTLLGLNTETDVGGAGCKPDSALSVAPPKSDNATATSLFQVQRADFLLAEWANRFPLPSAAFLNQTLPLPTPFSTTTVAVSSGSVITDSVCGNPSVSQAPFMSSAIKDEPTTSDPSSQPKIPVRAPVLPGVGPHSMSLPPSVTFSSSPQTNRKPRFN